jgi:uncharacterized protein YuzE
MEQTRKVQFRAPTRAVRIEFDPEVMAWYVRFRTAKVATTISEDAPGYVYAIDLDAAGVVIGFEILGVREFSIDMLLKNPTIDFSQTDFRRAKFVPATRKDSVQA